MVIKWIQSVTNRAAEAFAAHRGNEHKHKILREEKLVDVAHEALTKRAAEDRATLEALIKMGWPLVKREQFKGKVRKKVWNLVNQNFGAANSDIVEDITERIVDAAESDPYYRKMFDKEEA